MLTGLVHCPGCLGDVWEFSSLGPGREFAPLAWRCAVCRRLLEPPAADYVRELAEPRYPWAYRIRLV
jgi:hypothetical protein